MKPKDVKIEAWDLARAFLSDNFTLPITNSLSEVQDLAYNIQTIEIYDFKITNWEDFLDAEDRPEGLLERMQAYEGKFIVYDPIDNKQGFALRGNDPFALAFETCSWIWQNEPEEGPLDREDY